MGIAPPDVQRRRRCDRPGDDHGPEGAGTAASLLDELELVDARRQAEVQLASDLKEEIGGLRMLVNMLKEQLRELKDGKPADKERLDDGK